MRSIRRLTHFATALLILSSVAACGDKAASNPVAGGMPPPEVSVITIAPERITLVTELPGRLEATRIAQVRARVPGIVLKRTFEEGRQVKAGELLFQIDPTPFQATYNSAQAVEAKAEANLAQANLKVERYKPLVETNAISKQEYDDALTAQKQMAADLASAKAAQENAHLNLGYASVAAPISGQIGRALVTEGALVGQGEATPLAVIQQIDPIYVNVTQSSTDLLRLRQAIANGKLKGTPNQFKISLVTEDGSIYPHQGNLLFSDMTVDESSGSILMRASFPNPEHILLPGMYVRARIDQAVNEHAITVPQQAVIRSADGAAVLLVGADGKVISQPVQADTMQEGKWVISKGLKAGDQIIVEGFQKAKPGATVKPVLWQSAPPANQKNRT
ncbi:MAG TPA: efflux RND transporter periplasmic adaptor subunit [Burkholderiaceae bacterium]